MELFADKTFRLAMMISLFSHGVIFFGFCARDGVFRREKSHTSPEITYTRSLRPALPRSLAEAAPPETGGRYGYRTPDLRREIRLEAVRVAAAPEKTLFPEEETVGLPEEIAPAEMIPDKEVVVAPHRNEIPEGDVYLDYYHELRELVRRSVEYPRSAREGEVYLSFVVLRDGRLKDSPRVFPDRTTGTAALERAACRGIVNAAPFPPFPESIKSPRIVFELPVLFRRE